MILSVVRDTCGVMSPMWFTTSFLYVGRCQPNERDMASVNGRLRTSNMILLVHVFCVRAATAAVRTAARKQVLGPRLFFGAATGLRPPSVVVVLFRTGENAQQSHTAYSSMVLLVQQ